MLTHHIRRARWLDVSNEFAQNVVRRESLLDLRLDVRAAPVALPVKFLDGDVKMRVNDRRDGAGHASAVFGPADC